MVVISARSRERCCHRTVQPVAACRRDTVANALTRAATGTHNRSAPALVLAAAAADITRRVGALRRPAPRLIRWRVALLLGLLAATALAVAEAAHDTERLFEFAQTAYRLGHR
jgi:hypothetical protein